MVADDLQAKFRSYDENTPRSHDPDMTDIESASRIKELSTIPPYTDMPAVMAVSVFKNDRQRLAAVKLHKRHIKFNDIGNEKALRAWCASTVGEGGLGRFERVMAAVGLWADSSYRIARGMPRSGKDDGKVIRGSDFTPEDKDKIEGK